MNDRHLPHKKYDNEEITTLIGVILAILLLILGFLFDEKEKTNQLHFPSILAEKR